MKTWNLIRRILERGGTYWVMSVEVLCEGNPYVQGPMTELEGNKKKGGSQA